MRRRRQRLAEYEAMQLLRQRVRRLLAEYRNG
jgi:hypothetical protein